MPVQVIGYERLTQDHTQEFLISRDAQALYGQTAAQYQANPGIGPPTSWTTV